MVLFNVPNNHQFSLQLHYDIKTDKSRCNKVKRTKRNNVVRTEEIY